MKRFELISTLAEQVISSLELEDIAEVDSFGRKLKIEFKGELDADEASERLGLDGHPRLAEAVASHIEENGLTENCFQEFRDQRMEAHDPMGFRGLSWSMFA